MAGLFDEPEGKRRRDDGQARAIDAAQPWIRRARISIRLLAAERIPFIVDDLVAVVGTPQRKGQNRNNAVGALFAAMRREGVIEPTGKYQKTRRPEGHLRHVQEWIGR